MSQRRSVHERLFRAIVVMGASIGTSACEDSAPPPDAPRLTFDGQVADAGPTDGPVQDAPVDGVAIL